MPTLAGFQAWILVVAGISTGYLPQNSQDIVNAYNRAMAIVNPDIANIDPVTYADAVYNLAGDLLINYASDVVQPNASLAWLNGTVTVNTVAAHGFTTGDPIVISGVIAPGYNGKFQIAVTGTNTFTYPLATNPGAATVPGQSAESFFVNLRASWKITTFVPGVIASSGDESTNESLLNPEFMKNLTMSDLQRLKTPFGRVYMAIAQEYGGIVGLT